MPSSTSEKVQVESSTSSIFIYCDAFRQYILANTNHGCSYGVDSGLSMMYLSDSKCDILFLAFSY